jgi:glycosyltransferase involved in cell wall biosynthesis
MMRDGMSVRHVDLANAGAAPAGNDGAALTVYWWGDLPLGMEALSAAEMPESPATLDGLAARFAAEQRLARDPALGAPLAAGAEGSPHRALTIRAAAAVHSSWLWLEANAAPPLTAGEDLTVIVCTRDRLASLADCLKALLGQRSPPGEIVVVDNSADANAASVCAAFGQVRHVHEPRPGLSHARNTGLRAASRSLIAFTDDDVTPHPAWTAELVRAFADSAVEAVTGLVLPVRLDTWAQRCFQMMMGGFGDRFVPVLFDQRFFAETRADGAHVWRIGAGANMAFRRSVFDRIGAFDTRLGAGASGCSEDSEIWYRILATGGACLYEPRAVVFHDHRADWPGLERQIRSYMRGHVSALVAQRDLFGHRGNVTRIFMQLPRYFARTAIDSVLNAEPDRRKLLRQEIAGWASGLRYLVSPGWRSDRPTLPATGQRLP